MCIRTMVYSTWKEFVRDYKHDIYGKEYYVPREYLFRGQNNAKWELSSSFDRKYGSYEWQIRKKIEADLLKRFTTASKENECYRPSPITAYCGQR